MASAMSKDDMEAELFRSVEEAKKATILLLDRLDQTEILLQTYAKEAYSMRGKN